MHKRATPCRSIEFWPQQRFPWVLPLCLLLIVISLIPPLTDLNVPAAFLDFSFHLNAILTLNGAFLCAFPVLPEPKEIERV